jgi:glycosyltransferase involved in cell wall biosynthesis
MTVYGWRLWLDRHGEDVYGFDLSIELIRRLKEDYPRIGLVVLLPIIGDEQAYFESLERLVAREQSTGHVLFHTEPLPDAAPLWAKSSLFLRPTTTDGDAVSVREALALRVPVIASDCSPRPAGTLTFPTRSIDGFTRQVRLVLADREHYARQLEHIHIEDNFASILGIYRELLT